MQTTETESKIYDDILPQGSTCHDYSWHCHHPILIPNASALSRVCFYSPSWLTALNACENDTTWICVSNNLCWKNMTHRLLAAEIFAKKRGWRQLLAALHRIDRLSVVSLWKTNKPRFQTNHGWRVKHMAASLLTSAAERSTKHTGCPATFKARENWKTRQRSPVDNENFKSFSYRVS